MLMESGGSLGGVGLKYLGILFVNQDFMSLNWEGVLEKVEG